MDKFICRLAMIYLINTLKKMSNHLGLEQPSTSTSEYNDVPTGPDPELEAKAKGGVSWFYWIAALSLINSVAFLFGAEFQFLAGLGFTVLADAIGELSVQQGAPEAFRAVVFIINLAIFAGFALAGYYSNKLFSTVFLIGIIVYVFDAFLVLVLGEFFMAAFHAFALFFLIRGFLACRELNKFYKQQPIMVPPPPSL